MNVIVYECVPLRLQSAMCLLPLPLRLSHVLRARGGRSCMIVGGAVAGRCPLFGDAHKREEEDRV